MQQSTCESARMAGRVSIHHSHIYAQLDLRTLPSKSLQLLIFSHLVLPITNVQSAAIQITIYAPFPLAYHIALLLLMRAPNEQPCVHGSQELSSYIVLASGRLLCMLYWRSSLCHDLHPRKVMSQPTKYNLVTTNFVDQGDRRQARTVKEAVRRGLHRSC